MEKTARFLIYFLMVGTLVCVALWGGAAKAQSQSYTAKEVRAYFSETYTKVDNKERLRTGYAMAKTIVDLKERLDLMGSIERDWEALNQADRQRVAQEQVHYDSKLRELEARIAKAKQEEIAAAKQKRYWGEEYGLRSPSTIANSAPTMRCKPWGSHGEMRCTQE